VVHWVKFAFPFKDKQISAFLAVKNLGTNI